MKDYKPIIVLDDDPTGTQTVYGVPVLTQWSEEVIAREFQQKTPLFYILTNSRALIAEEANQLALEIGQNIKNTKQDCWLISRSDSTLRGHFPNEINALAEGLGWGNDFLTVLIPGFFEGNRFTKDDIHYLKEGENWIPVSETPYAQDKTFGYRSSNLKKWVEEKTNGSIKANEVTSISIEDLETGVSSIIEDKINRADKVLIINVLNYEQLTFFSQIIKKSKRKIIFRTAASFVASLGGFVAKLFLSKVDLVKKTANGGLIIVGSHVPKTTTQLNELRKTDIFAIEFDVAQFFQNPSNYIDSISEKLNQCLIENKNVVVFTSRSLITGLTEEESLKLSVSISAGLIQLVQLLKTQPRFLIAKGGITSSDLATKGLGVKRAIVLGQIEAGIPVWQLGDETRFPQLPYVVFPGNVGTNESLKNIYEILK